VPDPDPDPEDHQQRRTGRNGRKRKRAGVVRLFVGSEEPLFLNRNRVTNKTRKTRQKGRGRGRKKKIGLEKNRLRQAASSLPNSPSSSLAARDDVPDQNAALFEDHDHDPDPDADVDVDEGVWPGEYEGSHAPDEHVKFVPPGVSDVVALPPGELERAIGAAFALACSTRLSSGQSV
jgi:hypothetical protein